ncbi:SusD/RagB family nutrient-binding outer membrane lipoprotein [Labilibaculum sp. K2S]|uniref:SusD/RagB family nutrient-binding outer membrane lipoprotein n=1 Tax=Labilibaculum sp. K2S TaxID=3056386 RepID=UPI0025A3B86A|nr:SusD/RagB family nutrient-binding outer membrane lipoprotein [Labilibaculum sp. K2S]
MKNRLLYIFIFVLGLGFTACETSLDINDDPNNPTEATIGLVFPAAQASLTTQVSGQLFNLGGFFSQYWDQSPEAGQYLDLSNYKLDTESFQTFFDEAYSGGLNDLQYVLDKAEATGDWGNYLAATVVRAYYFQLLVDLYDEVPYTEALKGTEFIFPKYDKGEDVYNGIIAELDVALAKDFSGQTVTSKDLFFEGDLQAWIQFANSLKLKIATRAGNTALVNQLLTTPNFITKNVGLNSSVYSQEQNKRNPWYETNVSRLSGDGDYSINHVASHNFILYLQTKNDPRINTLFFPSVTTGNHNGNYFGSSKLAAERKADKRDDFSTVKIEQTHPSYIMLVSEVLLLQAEGYARAGDYAKAKSVYDQAVNASFELHGLDGASALLASGGSYEFTATNLTDALEQIMMQKYVCLAHFNNIEAWFEHNRTGYPKISPVPAKDATYVPGEFTSPVDNKLGDGRFPHRLYYTDSEVSSNPNTPEQINDITIKVWWDNN